MSGELKDFRPEWRAEYRDRHLTPDNGGFPTGRYDLSFVCPACGPPGIVCIKIGPSVDAASHCWEAHPMPDGADWPSRVTITPSINNTTVGHGPRRPPCTFHATIVGGRILP